MFTGIVTYCGAISSVAKLGENTDISGAFGARLIIQATEEFLENVGIGDSIALNGACMTVTSIDRLAGQFSIDISSESLSKTSGLDAVGLINLEKSMRLGGKIDGHMVTGHVDGVATVMRIIPEGESFTLCVRIPLDFAQFMAPKGSIALAGVSLTVNEVNDQENGCDIRVNLIPHTMTSTILGSLKIGSKINFEVDTLARYCARLSKFSEITIKKAFKAH
jgi:riboflavin synthase